MNAATRSIALLAALTIVALLAGGLVPLEQPELQECVAQVSGRRARFVQRYLCSPHLLSGGVRNWFGFASLWSWPLLLLGNFYVIRRDPAAPSYRIPE